LKIKNEYIILKKEEAEKYRLKHEIDLFKDLLNKLGANNRYVSEDVPLEYREKLTIMERDFKKYKKWLEEELTPEELKQFKIF